MKFQANKILSAVVIFAAALLSFETRAATTFIWNVATPGANNWNINANWLPNTGNPAAGDTANFGETGTSVDSVTVNNVVSVNTTISSLSYTNTASSTWHVTQIPASTTLTATNNLTVGGGSGPWTTSAALVDAGTLVVARNVSIGNNGTNSIANNTILDLSGLSNFVSGASSATFTLGNNSRSVGNLKLASRSNYITAATIALNTANNSSSGSGTVTLGASTNIINATNFNAGGNRGQCTIQFADSTGGLRVRGAGGADSDRANMTLGNHNTGGGGSTAAGTLSLNGHPVNMKLGTLNLGQSSSGPTGNSTGNGTIQFDTGVIDATTINMGISSGSTAFALANGSITVGTNATAGTNGVLIIGAGGVTMVNQSPASGVTTGSLTNNNALIICSGNIRKTNTLGTASIAVSGGTLSMAALTNTIGTTALPIDNLTLNNGTLTLPSFSGSPSAVVTTLNILGTSDIINVTSIPGLGQFQLIAYTTLNGSFDFIPGTLPPAYQGYISNNTTASSVDLVITNINIKTDTWRGNVSGNWDTSTLNWVSSGPSTYVQGDVVVFDDTLTGTANVNLTTSLLPNTINLNNSANNYVFSGSGKLSGTASLTKNGTGSLTLTEIGGDDFSGGIVVNSGTLVLDNANSVISGGLTINGGALRIGNNNGNGALPSGSVSDDGALIFSRSNNLAVPVPISGTGSLTHGGNGTLTLSGANSYTGNTTVSNGTLAFSGSGTIASSSQVNVNSGKLDISALSSLNTTLSGGLGLTNSSVTVALTTSGLPSLSSANLSFGGANNLINVLSFPTIASYPVTFRIVQSANAASGPFNVAVGTLPPATPSYAANVSQSGDQKAVLLTVTAGPVGARPFVAWNGADVPNLNTNWSDRLNWFVPDAPGAGDVVIFNNTASTALSALSTPGGGSAALLPENINNIVDANFTISSLTFTNDSNLYHNTFINSGRTLALTNALTLGAFDSGSVTQVQFVTISGAANASLNVNNATGNLQVWIGHATVSGSQATLDLSALDNFTATVSRFLVGASVGNAVNRPSGVVYLAKTNSITAGFQTTTIDSGTGTANAGIVDADCNGNAGSRSFIYLGRVNTLSSDTIAIGRQKAGGTLLFNPTYANTAPYPSVTFQGFSSSRVSNFQVGNGVGNGGTTTFSADANLSGGIVTAAINTLTIGRASTNGTGANTTTGTLEFDAGTINANTLNIGLQTTANSKSGVGTVSVSSNTVIGAAATLIVNGPVNLGSAAGGTGAASTSGTLNMTNGTVQANMIVPGTSSTITVAGGRLVVTNSVGPLLNVLNLVPLGTADNSRTELTLPVDGSPGITVSTLNLDGLGTTTNIINVGSVGPVGAPPVELPLIQYAAMNVIGGTFNVGLGTLPTGYTGYLTNDTVQSLIGVVLTSVVHPHPVMNSISQSGTNIVISGTNGFANAPYYVLTSTDVGLPLSSWTSVATNVFDSNGNFNFITPIAPGVPSRYFAIQVP